MSKFFEKLKKGLEDAVAHKKGKITLSTEIIEIPEPPAEYSAKEIRKIREKGIYRPEVVKRVQRRA
jgi:putative transcriptional regulator